MEFDIRLITIDSCRYDTALLANTPNLNKIGKLKKAETSGSYTYPAHHAFFIGDLPRIVDKKQKYINEFEQVWRSSSARKTNKKVFSYFDAPNIITYYQNIGYNVQGFGGVTFFSTFDKNNSLPRLFNNFHYFGSEINMHPYERIPRTERVFPLGNIDLIAESLRKKTPYFLFINCPETHIPYDVPEISAGDSYIKLIKRLYYEQNLKKRYKKTYLPFSHEEIQIFKNTQIKALEWVDYRIGLLFKKIPVRGPTLTIICSDHGEEFGDNGRFGHAHIDNSVMEVPVWSQYIK